MASMGFGVHAFIMIFVGMHIVPKLEDTVSVEINMLFHWNWPWDHGGGDTIFWWKAMDPEYTCIYHLSNEAIGVTGEVKRVEYAAPSLFYCYRVPLYIW